MAKRDNTVQFGDAPGGATPIHPQPKKKGGCLKILLALVLLAVLIAACQNMGKSDEATPAATTTAAAPTTQAEAKETTQAAETQQADEEQGSGLSAKQELAKAAAEQYLATMPFSKAGLIEQLSSDAGSQFDKADAVAAVETLEVDWKEQAAKAGQNYLETMPMSCDALIEQLSSEAGDKYTKEQATYGANQTKAC